MRCFHLYKDGRKSYIAEILDPVTGQRVCFRSTGTKNRDEAVMLVSGWLRDGIPLKKRGRSPKPAGVLTVKATVGLSAILKSVENTTELDATGAQQIVEALRSRGLIDFPTVKSGPGNVEFVTYLQKFWDYESSPYIREKKAHGQSIGRNHCYDLQNTVRAYYSGYFENRPLNSITRSDVRQFSLFLTEKREKPQGYKGKFAEKLSASTINKIMIAGTTALKWAFREGLIPTNVTEGLMRFSGPSRKRGILTPEEAETIFSATWEDDRVYVANLLACTTGLRMGEVLAIKKADISDKILFVRHSWSKLDGLKAPKNGEERKVPLLPGVREKLLELAAVNPYGPDGFIFYGLLPDKPINEKFIVTGLHAACLAVGIDSQARGIVFHSWRHTWVTLMAEKLAIDKIARVSGHKTKAMAEHYANHILDEAIEKTAAAGEEVFAKILKFKRGA